MMKYKTYIILAAAISIICISIFVYTNANQGPLSASDEKEKILSQVEKISEASSIKSEEMTKFEEKENEQEKIVDSDKVIIDEFKYLFDQPPAKQQ